MKEIPHGIQQLTQFFAKHIDIELPDLLKTLDQEITKLLSSIKKPKECIYNLSDSSLE